MYEDQLPSHAAGAHALATAPAGWQAELALRFVARDGRTLLGDRRHTGPLQVQRAFYPEGPDLCHVYVLHPPGGLVAADTLTVEVKVESGARTLVTTPAATKVYRGRAPARAHQRLAVAQGASLEWLPQETIVFEGAQVELATRVDLDQGAAFIGWEILCLGRPAAGEGFVRGRCLQRLELWRAGRPMCLERAALDGGAPVLAAPWGLRGAPVTATMWATPATSSDLERARASEAPSGGDLASVTLIDDVLVCRVLGGSSARARAHLERLWRALRPAVIGRPAAAPRIWLT